MTPHPIATELLSWYQEHKRNLPWRQTKDPYTTWISEVILQQTRVAQGIPYFHQFMETFPTVKELAIAHEDQVLKVWEGLGYYSRARNLHAGAKYIYHSCQGKFPENYDSLLQVKGIGPYTAAAIASICFDQPTPVLDGNVFRVSSRLFKIENDITKSSSRKVFISQLEQIISHQNPGDFNQAIMELGATVCSPTSPSCDLCPVADRCIAMKEKCHTDLPVKTKKVKVRHRYFEYLVPEYDGKSGMRKRTPGDVWQGLYDFHCEEVTQPKTKPSFLTTLGSTGDYTRSKTYQHVLTHQKIHARFHHVRLASEKNMLNLVDLLHLDVFSWSDIVTLPKPRLIVKYLNEHDL